VSHALGLSLSTEGVTDQAFLTPLIRRVVEALLQEHITEDQPDTEIILVGVRDLNLLGRDYDGDVYNRLTGASPVGAQLYEVFFIHADGGNGYELIQDNVLRPKVTTINAAYEYEGRYVRVVPVREMEAWAIADGDAIRKAFKVTLSDDQLGVPSPPRSAEKVLDPKARLQEMAERAFGRRRAKKLGISRFLSLIAEYSSIERLMLVPSFDRFYQETDEAVKDLVSLIALDGNDI
jgi:hypothetical protein